MTFNAEEIEAQRLNVLRIEVAKLCGDRCERCGGTGLYNRFGDHEWFRRCVRGDEHGNQTPIVCDHVTIDWLRSHKRLYPEYATDLRCMAQAEATLTEKEQERYVVELARQTGSKAVAMRPGLGNQPNWLLDFLFATASAEARARAFILTKSNP